MKTLLLAACLLLAGCSAITEPGTPLPDTREIPPSQTRTGDAAAGYQYLVEGNYVGRGIPTSLFKSSGIGNDPANVLGRTGTNADLAPQFTSIKAPNGVDVVAPNCLSCHGQTLNGEYIIGLGNSVEDFTTNSADVIGLLDPIMLLTFGTDSKEWEAYKPFRDATLAVGPDIQTPTVGMNPADKLTFVLASHRNADDLSWSAEKVLSLPQKADEIIPTDVPAWWLLRKKNAMFYTALGRGDFARISMAASLLTLSDTTEARVIDDRFADVVAYLKTLEPPPYPESIDSELAANGKVVFEDKCSGCHGEYGAAESYPNLLISLDKVGTDPALANQYTDYAPFLDQYNNGWFGTGPNAGQLVADIGYVAPPLDGIWATAPYLHNGSVPTLEDLLDSSQRPDVWRRTFNTSDLDYAKVGWNYTEPSGGEHDKWVYDTARPGHGNQGHTFGDNLSDSDRMAVIEYLKTL